MTTWARSTREEKAERHGPFTIHGYDYDHGAWIRGVGTREIVWAALSYDGWGKHHDLNIACRSLYVRIQLPGFRAYWTGWTKSIDLRFIMFEWRRTK